MPFAFVRYEDGSEVVNTNRIWFDKKRTQPFDVENVDFSHRYTVQSSKYKDVSGKLCKLKGYVCRVEATEEDLQKSLEMRRPRCPPLQQRESDVLSTTSEDDGMVEDRSVLGQKSANKIKATKGNDSRNNQLGKFLQTFKTVRSETVNSVGQAVETSSVSSENGLKDSVSSGPVNSINESMDVVQQSDSFDTGIGTKSVDSTPVVENESEVARLTRMLEESKREAAEHKRQADENAKLIAELRPLVDNAGQIVSGLAEMKSFFESAGTVMSRLESIEKNVKVLNDKISKCNSASLVQQWLDDMPCDPDVDFEL